MRIWTSIVIGAAAATMLAVSPAPAQAPPTAQSRVEPSQPSIIYDPIPYPKKRKKQMAGYSWRHYHQRTWLLQPVKQIILHYTVSNTYQAVHDWFASNTASPGNAGTRKEKPGECTHFAIDKNGKIYQLAPLRLMCRHVVGLNNQTIGIEFVEMNSARNILNRPRQLQAGLSLVRWLQSQYSVATTDVIGHAMANKSRFFVDYKRWFNDHTDWNPSQVRTFRRKL